MSNYFILIFFLLFITISILGYGFLLSNSLNKNLLKYNLGYIGLLGLLTLVSISYFTIFFIKHENQTRGRYDKNKSIQLGTWNRFVAALESIGEKSDDMAVRLPARIWKFESA